MKTLLTLAGYRWRRVSPYESRLETQPGPEPLYGLVYYLDAGLRYFDPGKVEAIVLVQMAAVESRKFESQGMAREWVETRV